MYLAAVARQFSRHSISALCLFAQRLTNTSWLPNRTNDAFSYYLTVIESIVSTETFPLLNIAVGYNAYIIEFWAYEFIDRHRHL